MKVIRYNINSGSDIEITGEYKNNKLNLIFKIRNIFDFLM